jgi:hypothetical protein
MTSRGNRLNASMRVRIGASARQPRRSSSIAIAVSCPQFGQ